MLLISLALVAIVLLIIAAPTMIAARIVGAGRHGFGSSLLALIVSFVIVSIAVRLFHGGGLLSFLVAPLGFMWILDTTYLRGMGIMVLQYLIAGLIVAVLMFTALGSMLHVDRTLRELPIDGGLVQSI